MSRCKRNVSLDCESLESRRVFSVGPVATAISGAVKSPPSSERMTLPAFDTSLSASFATRGNLTYINVDGSDFEDHIEILNYQPGGSVELRLEEWSGSQLLFSQTVAMHTSTLDLNNPVVVNGRGGNDQITNLSNAIASIYGGPGNDQIKTGPAGGYTNGEDGNDTLIGSTGADYLVGGAGDDYIRGGDGADMIYGGTGNDLLYGERGDDYLFGEDGNDRLEGDEGNDILYGGNNDDILIGGGGVSAFDGADSVFGGAGNDAISGNGGNDSLFGEDGNDTISGGDGNDVIHGGNGDDTLYGDDGNDRLYGDNGADSLYGGNGNDYLDGGYPDPDFYADFLVGGAGADTFVRHHSLHWFGGGDLDIFNDYNSAQGDSVDNDWHW